MSAQSVRRACASVKHGNDTNSRTKSRCGRYRSGESADLAGALVNAASGADEAQCVGEALRGVHMEEAAVAALRDGVRAAEEGELDNGKAEAMLALTRAAGVCDSMCLSFFSGSLRSRPSKL